MTRTLLFCIVLIGLSACNGTNPLMDEEPADTTTTDDTGIETNGDTAGSDDADDGTDNESGVDSSTTTDTGDPIDSNRTLLPGTTSPSANNSIFRREARDDESASLFGNGYAESVRYDGDADRFFVDNLAFDGVGGYTPVMDGAGNRLGIGPFNVFENEATAVDGLTLASIDQLTYRALYAVGPSGDTSIAIVRTGAYTEYGFGGYLYQRDGGVTLPSSGQAQYTGTDNYGGLRDFSGRGGLEYVSGDIEVRIDFNDFNEGAGVIGVVRNRRVFDMDGDDLTSTILSAMGNGDTQLPVLRFRIEPGVLDSNGELTGGIESVDPGDGEIFEEGSYYAVLSGDNAETITGIVVVTGDDPRDSDVTFRETAGFFAVRQ